MKRFKHWLSKIVALSFVLLALGLFSTPNALASNACECFCGNPTDGAKSIGQKDDANTCSRTCAETEKKSYVGCFADEAMYPKNNNLCWTDAECTSYDIDVSGTVYQGTWGEQSAFCSKQSVTGESMGYCYGPYIPVVLNVPILGVTSVGSIGEYVNLIYKYAIPLASLLGVLMFAIAGLQYMTAGGDKSAVTKAKTRMTNTVTGIVLLMSVYTIAYLVDPRLTRFNELRAPIVKEAVIVDDATTCEALFSYGFCIDGSCKKSDTDKLSSGACGDQGKITEVEGVDKNIANAPEIGDTCVYSTCSDKGKSCVIKGDNSGGTCVSCADVSQLRESNPVTSIGVSPSSSVCSRIASSADARDDNKDHVYLCYYDDDFSALTTADAAGVDECVSFQTSGDSYINCNKVIEEAEGMEDGCRAYESLNAVSFGQLVTASSLITSLFSLGSADQIQDFSTQFEQTCNQDICSVAGKGKESHTMCGFVEISIPGIFGGTTNHACTGK